MLVSRMVLSEEEKKSLILQIAMTISVRDRSTVLDVIAALGAASLPARRRLARARASRILTITHP
jgi:hypothetical protein